jgi:hypothetical protein
VKDFLLCTICQTLLLLSLILSSSLRSSHHLSSTRRTFKGCSFRLSGVAPFFFRNMHLPFLEYRAFIYIILGSRTSSSFVELFFQSQKMEHMIHDGHQVMKRARKHLNQLRQLFRTSLYQYSPRHHLPFKPQTLRPRFTTRAGKGLIEDIRTPRKRHFADKRYIE